MAIEFARPELLSLLLILPVWWLLVWPWPGRGVLFARGESARPHAGRWGARGTIVLLAPRLLRAAVVVFLVAALAEPQRVDPIEERSLAGKGIGLAVDLSSSMLAEDMDGGRSRIDLAREAAVRFAAGRTHDELSLVGFAREAVTRIPPTTDPNVVVAGVESLEVQLVGE
jgi:Ca-activated chloride channel family protein